MHHALHVLMGLLAALLPYASVEHQQRGRQHQCAMMWLAALPSSLVDPHLPTATLPEAFRVPTIAILRGPGVNEGGCGIILLIKVLLRRGGIMMKFAENCVRGKIFCMRIYVGIREQNNSSAIKLKSRLQNGITPQVNGIY